MIGKFFIYLFIYLIFKVLSHLSIKYRIVKLEIYTNTIVKYAQPEIFQVRGGFVKLEHFDKYFIEKSRKKAPQGKILEFFSLRYS